MRVQPDDLDAASIGRLVTSGWGTEVTEIAYAPWGFGSHHWVAELADGRRWFVSADTVGPPGEDASALVRLEAALQSACAIHEAGLDFVVAPKPAADGAIVQRVGRYAVAVYPFVEGRTFQPWSGTGDGDGDGASIRAGVVDLLVAVHGATPIVTGITARENFAIQDRDLLEIALAEVADTGTTWDGGPYAEPARLALAAAHRPVGDLLSSHDEMAHQLVGSADGWVLTHGEPKAANLMTSAGGARLIDWDTALIAPAARDLWLVEAGLGVEVGRYEQESGRAVEPMGPELYRMRWGLADLAANVAQFRGAHRDDEDSRIGWAVLQASLTALADGRPLPVETG